MVGSVLMERMRAEGDFELIDPVFFTTSNVGGGGPGHRPADRPAARTRTTSPSSRRTRSSSPARAATTRSPSIPKLRAAGWNGYWIDAASALRMEKDAVIILDPVNRPVIDRALAAGVQQLHRRQLHREPHAHGDRRAAQGGPGRVGIGHDLPGGLGGRRAEHARAPAADGRGPLRRQGAARRTPPRRSSTSTARWPGSCATRSSRRRTSACRWPGACCPGSTADLGNGQSREEWKGHAETNKILGREERAGRGGRPVRARRAPCAATARGSPSSCAGTSRSRRSSRSSPKANDWVRVVPNRRAETLERLTPAAVTGTLEVPIGRLAQAAHGWRVSVRVHGRRPAALGRGGAAAADAAHRLRGASVAGAGDRCFRGGGEKVVEKSPDLRDNVKIRVKLKRQAVDLDSISYLVPGVGEGTQCWAKSKPE